MVVVDFILLLTSQKYYQGKYTMLSYNKNKYSHSHATMLLPKGLAGNIVENSNQYWKKTNLCYLCYCWSWYISYIDRFLILTELNCWWDRIKKKNQVYVCPVQTLIQVMSV